MNGILVIYFIFPLLFLSCNLWPDNTETNVVVFFVQVCSKMELTTQHGAIPNKTQTILAKIYNLDAILSVGYRVNSINATLFKKWANKVRNPHVFTTAF